MNKPAFDVARELYAERGGDFKTDLIAYLRAGIVFSSPNVFYLAIATQSDGREIDTWYVPIAAVSNGSTLADLVRFIPARLPYVSFYRHGQKELRLYRLDRLKRLALRPSQVLKIDIDHTS